MSYVHKILRHYADADKWITVHPNGADKKGSPVKIGPHGEVKAGMGGRFLGEKISGIRRWMRKGSGAHQGRFSPTRRIEKSGIVKPKSLPGRLEDKLPAEFLMEASAVIRRCQDADAVSIWQKYRGRIRVSDVGAGVEGQFDPGTESISIDATKPTSGEDWDAPYEIFFHESAHNIDWLAGKRLGCGDYFSRSWIGGRFGQVIREEVLAYQASMSERLKEEFEAIGSDEFIKKYSYAFMGFINPFTGAPWKPIRWDDALANSVVGRSISLYSGDEIGAISDIIGGATKLTIDPGIGHELKYWNSEEDQLPVEAFADLYSAKVANPIEFKTFCYVFPKSAKMFEKMLKEVAK